MTCRTASSSLPSISTYQSPAPGFGSSGWLRFRDSSGSLSTRCSEMMPWSIPGSSSRERRVRNASLLAAPGRRRTTPRTAPRPWPRLTETQPTTRPKFREARYVLLRPIRLVRQHRLVGRAAQCLEAVRRVGAEILGRGFLGDPAPCLEKALDADALGEMLAVVPEIEILLVGGVHVHRRDEHPLACQGHSERLPFVSAASARRRRRTIRASSLLWTEVKVPGAASRSGYSCRRSPSRKASGPCGSTAL